jgi:predicted ATPase
LPDIAESQPELLAKHFTEADLIEKAASLWGTAAQRSLARSALVEAVEQFARALSLIAALPATPALRRDEIKFQVAIITPLIHVKGHAAPETRGAVERARQLVEKAELLGEPAGDPLLAFAVLYGLWTATFITFDGNISRQLAVQFLERAQKQGAAVPIIVGHRLLGLSLFITGNLAEGRAHLSRAIELCDPAEHRPLAMRFGQDARTTALSYRSWALWLLGCPAAALADVEQAAREAREIGHVGSLMHNLTVTTVIYILCGRYAAANAQCDDLVPLEEEKGALMWKAWTRLNRGCVLAITGNAADAIAAITSEISAFRSTGATINSPLYLSYLATAHAKLDHQRCLALHRRSEDIGRNNRRTVV